MSQRVPNFYIDDVPPARSATGDIPTLDLYEVAELTWENGHLGLHGLGPPRLTAPSKYSTGAGGTLESVVDQATRLPTPKPSDELVPGQWIHHRSSRGTMDALVPCSDIQEQGGGGGGGGGVGSTRVDSCSDGRSMKRARLAPEWSVSGSQQQLTMDTYGFTSTSMGSQGNTMDDHDSVCHSRSLRMEEEEEKEKKAEGKSSVSTKRSRAAAIHNQSERKRRDKINQRMKTLQKLVPNSSKTDKASMLDEVIEYLKQLQAQVSMVSRMNMPSMMLPIAMQQHQQQQQQQQLQLSLMSSPMGLGFNMGMHGLGLHANMLPNPFVPMTSPSWDASSSNDSRFQSPLINDPMVAFLSCSSQPTTMEAYSRMAALYQQMQQQVPPPPSNPK